VATLGQGGQGLMLGRGDAHGDHGSLRLLRHASPFTKKLTDKVLFRLFDNVYRDGACLLKLVRKLPHIFQVMF